MPTKTRPSGALISRRKPQNTSTKKISAMKYMTSELERSKPKKLGFSAIAKPSEPPVTSRHFNATEKTSCENASVSIRKVTPPVRTQNQPIRAGGKGRPARCRRQGRSRH